MSNVLLQDLVNQDGLDYAYYVNMDRALVDIYTDGLKPVQRRLLYALSFYNKLTKGLRVIGDVMGKYHPHGDSGISSAIATMGQHFNSRIPMFEIQGTLGDFTGDDIPAERYYEIMLNRYSRALVDGVKDKAVPMRYTEVGDDKEPSYLPTDYPVFLTLGSQGIAVGYSCNYPSHNPVEVMNGVIAYFKGNIKTVDDVLNYIKAPDYSTGCDLIGIDGVREYYSTGKGSFYLQGKYRIENLSRGRTSLLFYEIPHKISIKSLIEKINKLQKDGFFSEISSAKDLSDKETGVLFEITLKNGSNVNKVLSDLFEKTDLRTKVNVSATALVKGKPVENISILEILKGYKEHKIDCTVRKLNHLSIELEKQLSRNNAILLVTVDVDKAIDIIRKADDVKKANKELRSLFKVTEEQAEYILSLQLRQLTKADKVKIENKVKELDKELKAIKKALSNGKDLTKWILKELEETKELLSDFERRTTILEITNEDLLNKEKESKKQEKLLQKGTEVYLTIKGTSIIKSLENKGIKVNSKDNIYVLLNNGELVELPLDNIEIDVETDVKNIFNKAIGIVVENYNTFVADKNGNVIIVKPNYKVGQFINSDNLIYAKVIEDEEYVGFFCELGKMNKIKLDKIRQVKQGSGLIQGMMIESPIVSTLLLKDADKLVVETNKETTEREVNEFNDKGRNTKGYLIQRMRKEEKIIKVDVK